MSNSKSIAFLLVALFVVGVIHAVLSYRGDVANALVQRSELVADAMRNPDSVKIERPGRSEIVLKPEKGWSLARPYSALADGSVVKELLDRLASESVKDTLGDGELLKLGRTREDFGLVEPKVKITLSAGSSSEEILLGDRTPSGSDVYAAVTGENAVYVVPASVFEAANRDADGFRRRTLFSSSTPTVLAFDLKRGSGSFLRFVKDGDVWSLREPFAAAASDEKVKGFLESALTATAVDFVWPVGGTNETAAAASASQLAVYGLDPESAVTLTLRSNDGVDRRVVFGKTAEDGRVFALVHDGGAIVTVDGKLKDAALAGVNEFTDTRIFLVDPAQATRVSIVDGGTTYLLARDAGAEWRLDTPVSAATDKTSVDAFLVRLFALGVNDVVEGGVAVSVGSSAQVFVSRDALLGSLRLEDLRSREIVRIDPAAVKRVSIDRAGGSGVDTVVYDRDRRAWNVERTSAAKGVASDVNVARVLGALNPLLADAIARLKVTASDLKVYGLETPAITVAIDQDREGTVRKNLLIGNAAPGGGRYATIGATDAVFILSDVTVSAFESPLVIAD